MDELLYTLQCIPDFTLSKYSALEENDIPGVLKIHRSFLRQINRIGILTQTSMHLFYQYDNCLPKGKRIRMMLMFRGDSNSLKYVESIMLTSSLNEYFLLRKTSISALCDKAYDSMVCITKKENFMNISQPNGNLADGEELYSINEWKMNDSARLYNMLKLLKGLDTDCMYRVDIYPVDYTEKINSNLTPILNNLRKQVEMRIDKTMRQASIPKDKNIEMIIRKYEKMIELFETNPHYMVNVRAFSNDNRCAQMIVDSACAEALESGTYSVYGKKGIFMYNSLMGIEQSYVSSEKTYERLCFLPCLFTLDELLPFFVLPTLYDAEVIEIPKETAPIVEKVQEEEKTILLGIDSMGYDVKFPIKLFAKHAFIAGVPGSGKTNTMLHLTSMLWKKYNIPFLVLEPAKQEYRVLATQPGMEEMLIFSPSAGTKFSLHINPFEFPVGMPLAEHIRHLCEVFEGAFSLFPPMPFLLDYSIEAIYREKGWFPETINDGKTLEYPTMSELYERLEKEVENTEYGEEQRGNLKSALQVRIGSLLRREMGDVFDCTNSTMRPEEWLQVPALIELESMGSGPANFLNLMLATLIRESLKVDPLGSREMDIRHVLFFEEAHNLIGPEAGEAKGEDADPKAAATSFLVKMLAEVRALREGIVIADQLPTAMAPEVIKNTGLKIAHRITSEDDRGLIGGTMSATAFQLEDLALFEQGFSLTTYEGLLKPFKMRVCKWADGEISYDSPNNAELYDILVSRVAYRKVCVRNKDIDFKRMTTLLIQSQVKIKSIFSLQEDIEVGMKIRKEYEKKCGFTLEDLESPAHVNDKNELIVARKNKVATDKARNLLQERVTVYINELQNLMIKFASMSAQNLLYQDEYVEFILDVKKTQDYLLRIVSKVGVSLENEYLHRFDNTIKSILRCE